MSRKSRMICIAVSTAIAVFMAVAPGYFSRARQEINIRKNQQGSRGFQGIISVWHVVGFKPYQGSLGSWLKARGDELENRHAGVYFEVDSITMEEAENRIARGEMPDIYSFPLGWADAEQLRDFEVQTSELRGNLAECGKLDGRLFAVPFAASGYMVAANLRVMQELGIEQDAVPGLIRDGSLQIAGDQIVGAVYNAGSPLLSQEEFLDGKAAVALADGRTVGDIARKVQQGKGFPYTAIQYGNYSDLAQLIGISRYIEEGKLDYAMELIELVMEKESQLSLYDSGLVPAIKEDGGTEQVRDELVEIMALELQEIAAPNSFLYKRYRDQLYESAAAALAGDSTAKKDFDLRMRELVRGEVIK